MLRATLPLLRSVAPLAEGALETPVSALLGGDRLLAMLRDVPRLVVLTGAGLSTASGIPDYRSPGRPDYRPLQHGEFVAHEAVRRRYWARSFVGWPRMRGAQPNGGHVALAALEQRRLAGGSVAIVTQNVDRLHLRAGSRAPLELHGTIHEVVCTGCGTETARDEVQTAMLARNARWLEHFLARAVPRPDGDVDLPAEAYASFDVPVCAACRGPTLRPRVVFYGGTIPPAVTEAAYAAVDAADALLVVGTSCTVFSAFRLVRRAAVDRRVPVGIINFGLTRADALASWKVEAHTSTALGAAVAALRLEGLLPPAPLDGVEGTALPSGINPLLEGT